MDAVINDFVQVLRNHQLRVSPAESIDALLALRQVGLGERGMVRDTLRATLIKNQEDTETFDRLFDLYFSLRPHTEKPAARLKLPEHDHDHGPPPAKVQLGEDAEGDPLGEEGHDHGDGDSTDMRRFFDKERMRPSQNIHGEEEKMRLSMFSQELILNRKPGAMESALQRLTYHMKIRRSRNMFNPGGLIPDTGGEEVPLDVSAIDLEELVDHLHEMEVDEALIEQLEAQAENILKGLPELIKQMQEREKKLKKDAKDDSEIRHRALRKMLNFSASEQREMEAAIRRISRRIQGAKTRRLKEDRTGRISVSHTLRHNIRYEGIPFDPVLRKRREGKPRVALLCDVSLSTRNLARFWLHMVYQMQSLFSKVRTFVFVADTAEVTQLLEEHSMNRAVEEIFSGRILDADVNSDFGKAAEQFKDRYLPTINHRTTVVILGDGRNNGKHPNAEALEEIAQHARQTIWITPEPRWGWTLGSCDMPLYEKVCDRVEVVRTVDQLAGVAEELVKVRA
ncbi:MAG TPA: VWA domain-containing protein [Rubrobacteraceae bacterium]|nr:VWA domain-containing protein [Rubrobacteraceae bacterium]